MKAKTKTRVLLLDRDGTIMRDEGYVNSAKMVHFYPFTLEALKRLAQHFRIFIVTNQPGMGWGYISEEEYKAVTGYILKYLLDSGINIEGTFYCPHKEDAACECRKPSPFFFEKLENKYDIIKEQSYMIGDHPSDMRFAANCGINGVYVITGHGKKHLKELGPEVLVAKNLKYAAEKILSRLLMS
jgi:D-glycero-D-manno-heptose 1,7-bisphosphate phosphatase